MPWHTRRRAEQWYWEWASIPLGLMIRIEIYQIPILLRFALKCPIPASAFLPNRCRGYSIASSASTRRVPKLRAVPGWDSRLCRASCCFTAVRSRFRVDRDRGLVSRSVCRRFPLLLARDDENIMSMSSLPNRAVIETRESRASDDDVLIVHSGSH